MSYRSPTRYLAPVALLAAVLAIYLVARPQLGSSEESSPTSGSQSAPARTTTTSTSKKKPAGKPRKTYTVKSGDVLGGISEETGVPIDDLLDFNDIDASQLSVGQKLKLTP